MAYQSGMVTEATRGFGAALTALLRAMIALDGNRQLSPLVGSVPIVIGESEQTMPPQEPMAADPITIEPEPLASLPAPVNEEDLVPDQEERRYLYLQLLDEMEGVMVAMTERRILERETSTRKRIRFEITRDTLYDRLRRDLQTRGFPEPFKDSVRLAAWEIIDAGLAEGVWDQPSATRAFERKLGELKEGYQQLQPATEMPMTIEPKADIAVEQTRRLVAETTFTPPDPDLVATAYAHQLIERGVGEEGVSVAVLTDIRQRADQITARLGFEGFDSLEQSQQEAITAFAIKQVVGAVPQDEADAEIDATDDSQLPRPTKG